MKRVFSTIILLVGMMSAHAAKLIEFKIPVLSVSKGNIGDCSRLSFEYYQSDSKEPLSIGNREDTPSGTGDTIKGSLWLAGITAALQRNAAMNGVKITIDFKDYINGPSAGGIICLAILTAMDGRTIPPDFAMTGTIMPDGTIGLVGGVQYKLRAAAKANIKRVCIPAGLRFEKDDDGKDVDLLQVAIDNGMELHFVKNIRDAYSIMHRMPKLKDEFLAEDRTLSPAIEKAALDLFNEGVNIHDKGMALITDGDERKIKMLRKDEFLWGILNIETSKEFKRSNQFLLAIESMKLPMAAWGTLSDTLNSLSRIQNRHPGYKKEKSVMIDYLLDLSESVRETFISKYFMVRVNEGIAEPEQSLYNRLTQDTPSYRFRPINLQNDIPAQLEQVNRLSASIPYAKQFLFILPNKEKLETLDIKDIENMVVVQERKLLISAILGRLDVIDSTYLEKLSKALPQLSSNADVDVIEHLFYATGRAADAMFVAEYLPSYIEVYKAKLLNKNRQNNANKPISENDVISYLENNEPLFLSWKFARIDSLMMHMNKKHAEYKSYHDVAALKSHILLFTTTHALMCKMNPEKNLSQLIDLARFQAISSISECKSQNIPCLQANIFFEQAENNRNVRNSDLIEDVLVNYWNANLQAKALLMSFSRGAKGNARPQVVNPSQGNVVNPSQGNDLKKYAVSGKDAFMNRDYQKAFEMFVQADQNDPEVRYCLGLLCYDGLTSMGENIDLAIEHLQFAANSGKADAYYPLGKSLLLRDEEKAFLAFEAGANQLNDFQNRCQFMLGRMYETGTGTPKNLDKAKMWFYKSAQNNYAPALKRYNSLRGK